MALPTRVNTHVDLQVSGSAVRAIALKSAVETVVASTQGGTTADVIAVAREYEHYIETGGTLEESKIAQPGGE